MFLNEDSLLETGSKQSSTKTKMLEKSKLN